MNTIRPAIVAGSFYPADPTSLKRHLTELLDNADDGGRAVAPDSRRFESQCPKVLIVPHAGTVYSGPVAAAAYALLRRTGAAIRRVVLLGPSHRVGFPGLALSSAGAWRTPLGDVPLDTALAATLTGRPCVTMLDTAHAREHALEVQLPFLQISLGAFTLLPVVTGEAGAAEVADVLDAVWGGPETLIVISTDLSHYLDYATCRRTDGVTAAAVERFDAGAIGRDDACGRVPLAGLLTTARRRPMAIRRLDLRNSGDTAGPRERVVGYGAWALYETERTDEKADDATSAARAAGPAVMALARLSIASNLAGTRPLTLPATEESDPLLTAPGAAFVTLKRDGALRGCIGSATARRSLAEDVWDNAYKAAFADPRFPPLAPNQITGLTVSVAILTSPAPMRFTDETDLLAQLRPGIDGLILDAGRNRALFLPAVWDSLPDATAFLAHLKNKAGLPGDFWSPSIRASRFEAVEIGPEPW